LCSYSIRASVRQWMWIHRGLWHKMLHRYPRLRLQVPIPW
jgi:hypothetical protein